MKIAIIGHSGAGKSTVAAKLAQYYQLPLLYLDTVKFLPNWQERDDQLILQQVGEFLATNEQWVIDGNYFNIHGEQRFASADLIIYLDYSRPRCLYQAWQRYRQHLGSSRPSMTPGCEEKLDLEFLTWILFTGRSMQRMRKFRQLQRQYTTKVLTFHGPKALNQWLSNLYNSPIL